MAKGQIDVFWELQSKCNPVHFDAMPPKDARKPEGLRNKYGHLRYSHPEAYKVLVGRMNDQGDPMAYWEDPTLRQSKDIPVQPRRRLTKEEEEEEAYQRHLKQEEKRRILRMAKSRARSACGALITNMDVDKCPPPMMRIHSMPKSTSAPLLHDTRSKLQMAQDRKKLAEEKETIHTLRLAKWKPRSTNGAIITIPYLWEKVHTQPVPGFAPG
jgi:hypothetical protein